MGGVDSGRFAVTGDDGAFYLAGVTAEHVNLRVTRHGYEDVELSVKTMFFNPRTVEIVMRPAPVKYERVCQSEGKPVAWEDLVKGYEYEKGQFVVLTKDDFKTAALEKTKTIDILDFVDPKEIDERYFETPYYLQPAKGADRAYALLREAIRQSGRIGIAKIILRDAQHLAAVEAIGDALVLTMMRFADELADMSEFRFPKADDLRKPELNMAIQLIENLASTWEPEKYTDEYRENLMRLIEGKLKGRRPKLKDRETPQQAEVVDLMTRLRASLQQRKPQRTKKADSKKKGKKIA